jgi:Cu+-exporting ATPase
MMAVIDPVCGMEVEEDEAEHSFRFGDETYYFCCEACRDDFVANPGDFVEEELVDERLEEPARV